MAGPAGSVPEVVGRGDVCPVLCWPGERDGLPRGLSEPWTRPRGRAPGAGVPENVWAGRDARGEAREATPATSASGLWDSGLAGRAGLEPRIPSVPGTCHLLPAPRVSE